MLFSRLKFSTYINRFREIVNIQEINNLYFFRLQGNAAFFDNSS